MKKRTLDVVKKIVVHHSASDDLVLTWADIRRIHMEPPNEFHDIGYHRGVVRDDKLKIIDGRSLTTVGAHCKNFNTFSVGLMFEGNFETTVMSRDMFETGVIALERLLVELPHLGPDDIVPHRDFGSTATVCPGKYFPINEMIGRIKDESFLS